MRTAIITKRDNTTLIIKASEELHLEQMGREDRPIKLSPGANQVVVGVGVFRILSRTAVSVTADTTEFVVAATLNNKDSWPDSPKLFSAFDREAVLEFFADAKGTPAPR